MTVLMDNNNRVKLLVRECDDRVFVVGYADNGSVDLFPIPRYKVIDSRAVDVFESRHCIVSNISGGDLAKKFLGSRYIPVTRAARDFLEHVIWIEDTVEYLREKAARTDPKAAIRRAWRIRGGASE